MAHPKQSCPSCQSSNDCKADSDCWCHQLPPIAPANAKQCYCSSCLLDVVIQEAQRLVASKKHEQIANLGPVKNPIQGLDYTINSEGNLVFTPWYHLRRGTCCGSGCMHCPYEWKNVVQ